MHVSGRTRYAVSRLDPASSCLDRQAKTYRMRRPEYGFEVPGKIDSVADPGVHPLPADRIMNVCRIAEQKRPSFLEMLRDTMMNMIGRKRVYFFDVQLTIACRAGGLGVSSIKEVMIGAARKSRANRLAHNRARAVTGRYQPPRAGDTARACAHVRTAHARPCQLRRSCR